MSSIQFTQNGETVGLDLTNIAQFIEQVLHACQGMWEWLKNLFEGIQHPEAHLHAV